MESTEAVRNLVLGAVIFFAGFLYGVYKMWRRGR